MRLRRHACLVIALAFVSAACSGPTRGRGDAAPGTSTSPSTIPGSFHDTAPGSPEPADSSGPPTSSVVESANAAGKNTTTTRSGATAISSTTTFTSNSSPTTATSTTVPPGLPAEHCPEPKTCRRYTFGDGTPRKWRAGADGRVTIRYRINPSGATSISPESIEGAIRTAFDTWERAAPAVRFVYDGRTSMQATPDDGVSVIAFNGPTTEHTIPTGDKDGNYLTEFDMLYTPNGWTWAPCEQADNSCTPTSGTQTGPASSFPRDLQSIATHAAGHALWLGDMEDYSLDRYLTMNPGNWSYPAGSRYWSTLALGDVLGVRALYPCSCPLPPIYSP